MLQPVAHRAAQDAEFNRFKRRRGAALIQLRQTDNIFDQRQQPLCL